MKQNLILEQNYNVENLFLKHFTALSEEESEAVRSWRNHQEVRAFMYQQHITSKEEHQRFVKGLHNNLEKGYWAVFKENEGLGVISLTRINIFHSYAFLGIYVSPQWHHQGVGKQLLSALEFLAFQKIGLHSLRLEVLEENQKAIAFYERNGFLKEGCLRDFALIHGQFKNIVLMGKIDEN
ncbi:UDP-4-amino-4,6-dideoxy-N-acetyl-beta-L-altrosamine N-acetyltransferase [Helicobacter monodelphidis]|uniref:UDP-4-amino-4, 6-dideoxy-N-acetyl-beta-L-altrosamine N-acetyltransferase n=1 Tax=Helicobacter sp. 15-1451 TaxID=2004995 RepID=UPI0015EC2197|nr:UDP-4-amino-4,6-dideoxy-N-acetyl-beta-L-altrosamine N-acetyltransferase [Helicobacter sp. 15-1451]